MKADKKHRHVPDYKNGKLVETCLYCGKKRKHKNHIK